MVYFPSNLRRVRMNKGINQTTLAAMLDVRPNTISNYENGISSPDFEIMEKLTGIFGVTVDALLYKNLSEDEKYNTISGAGKGGYNPDYKESNENVAEEPSADYKAKKSDDTAFWIIMDQLKEIRKELSEVKSILEKRT
jgi:transcriptional regulator with XRE-family HTH domain